MQNNFHGGHWGQCLELLSHLCQYGDDILLVSGPSGIGKSAMKEALINQGTDKFTVCEVWATPTITAEGLTERIEIECDNQENKELLLLIDDAQNLPLDVITLLLQLKQRSVATSLLHIVLFATPEFEMKISRSILKDEFFEQCHTIEIEPLTLAEVEAFLTHEWRDVHNSELLLSKSKCKKIYTLSGGIPGKAKQVAKEVLSGKGGSQPRQNKTGLSPFAVGVTVSFGILFCILAVIWPAADETLLVESPAAVAIAKMPEPICITEPTPTEPTPETTEILPVAIVATPVTDDDKIARLEDKLKALQQQLSAEQEARRAAEARFNHKPITQARNSVHETHILAMPSKNYALQLLGTSYEKKAQDFIFSNKLTNKAYYYRGIHKGKPWFIVVYGSYPSKIDAQNALYKLPISLRKLRPWPRQYSNIQNSIIKNTKK